MRSRLECEMQQVTAKLARAQQEKTQHENLQSPERQDLIMQVQLEADDQALLQERMAVWNGHAAGDEALPVPTSEEELANLLRGCTDWTAPLTWYGKKQFDVSRLLEGGAVPTKWCAWLAGMQLTLYRWVGLLQQCCTLHVG